MSAVSMDHLDHLVTLPIDGDVPAAGVRASGGAYYVRTVQYDPARRN
jgi:hypothetical protein